MNEKEFREKYCNMCGSQRCEGIHTEWFEGCKHKQELTSAYTCYGICTPGCLAYDNGYCKLGAINKK